MQLPQNPRLVFGLITGVVAVTILGVGVGQFNAPAIEISTPPSKSDSPLASQSTELTIPKLTVDPFAMRSQLEEIANPEAPSQTTNPSMSQTIPTQPQPSFTNSSPERTSANPQIAPFNPREISGSIPEEPNVSPLPNSSNPQFSDFPPVNPSSNDPGSNPDNLLPQYDNATSPTPQTPEPPKNPNSVRLTAIIISKTPTAYIALGNNSAVAYKEGESIKPGLKIVKITSETVTLQKAGKSATLSVGKDGVLP